MRVSQDEIKEVLGKPASYGLDVDISEYIIEEPIVEENASTNLKELVGGADERIGFTTTKASYVQVDQIAFYKLIERRLRDKGVIIAPLTTALNKYDLAKELSWKLIDPRSDKYTALTYLKGGELGYFIYIPPGAKIETPIYACLVLRFEKKAMLAHNIVYVGEGSEAHVVTGCAVPHGIKEGIHIGISEFYVSKNARLTFSMIHAWSPGIHVRPRTAIHVDEGGKYVGYYITYSPVASLQTYPIVRLRARAKAHTTSVISGLGSGDYDIGTRIILEDNGASGEIISRTLGLDSSRIKARAEIIGKTPDTRGHIECLGLLVSDKASIAALPQIISESPGSILTHEAAIGRISREELEYLMSRGFTEDEAKSIIVRGFMKVYAPEIPDVVKKQVDNIINMISRLATG